MQEVLRRLSQQQSVQSKETQQSLIQCEPSEHNTLIQKLQQIVAEKQAKIKELEGKIQQLSVKVKKKKLSVQTFPIMLGHLDVMLCQAIKCIATYVAG